MTLERQERLLREHQARLARRSVKGYPHSGKVQPDLRTAPAGWSPMPTRPLTTRSMALAATLLLLAGTACAAAAGTAVSAPQASCASLAAFSRLNGALFGVAPAPGGDAWAVGLNGRKTLIIRWNGKAWQPVPSPAPAPASGAYGLQAAAAVSSGDAWAVGGNLLTHDQALILHWNGTAWKRVPSPRSARGMVLYSVAATSARNAWAAGYGSTGTTPRPLILHWNGTAWKPVPGRNPGGRSVLTGVAAISEGDAWAVGYAGGLLSEKVSTLILHWNGRAWRRVPSPNPAGRSVLIGVAATSAQNAWAVGRTGVHSRPLILHWNGTAWRQIPGPRLSDGGWLNGVAASATGNAWAVGRTGPITTSSSSTLILHWNGSSWKNVSSPKPAAGTLYSVAASAKSAWAVGQATTTRSVDPSILRCTTPQ
jgi:hypothetical protein